jgi:tRNA U34 2-thiouridine synthase MnmA/TrmU
VQSLPLNAVMVWQVGGVSERWFVAGKDMAKNEVYVVPGTHHPALYSDYLEADESAFNWICDPWVRPMSMCA